MKRTNQNIMRMRFKMRQSLTSKNDHCCKVKIQHNQWQGGRQYKRFSQVNGDKEKQQEFDLTASDCQQRVDMNRHGCRKYSRKYIKISVHNVNWKDGKIIIPYKIHVAK